MEMLDGHCLLLLFFAFLISSKSGEVPLSKGLAAVEMSCFDPACSTPYLLGELIADLPELSLFKGTVAQVIAQSSDFYRVKVSDVLYDVPLTFLHITKRLHQIRGLVRSKLPPVNPSTGFTTTLHDGLKSSDPEQVLSLSLNPTQKQAPALKQADIKSSPVGSGDFHPSIEPLKMTEDASERKPVDVKASAPQKVAVIIPPHPASHEAEAVSPLEQQKVLKSNTMLKQAIVNIMSSVEKPSQTSHRLKTELPVFEAPVKPIAEMPSRSQESKATPTVGPLAGSDSKKIVMPPAVESPPKLEELKVIPASKIELPAVRDSKQNKEDPPPMVDKTKTTPVSPVEFSEQLPVVETPPNTGELKVEPSSGTVSVQIKEEPMVIEKLLAVKDIKLAPVSESKLVKHPPFVEISPKVDQIKITSEPNIEPLAGSDSKQIKEDPVVVATSSKVEENKVTSIHLVKSTEPSPIVEKPFNADEFKASPQVVIAPESDSKQREKQPSYVESVVPVSQTTQPTSYSPEITQQNEGVKAFSEPIDTMKAKNISNFLETRLSESEKRPPSVQHQHQDVHLTAKPNSIRSEQPTVQTSLPEFEESVMSQSSPLLDISSESAFFHCLSFAANGSVFPPNFSAGEKSLFAGAILFCARYFFNAAQALLLKFPRSFVASLDSIFAFTFKVPLVFLIAWTFFILTALVTFFFIKLFNKFLFHGFTRSNPDDPTNRSLAQWLEVEENANLLADSLADKEEAYGRLIVWSTKVSERYENQHRNHISSSIYIHSQLKEAKAALADSLHENKELRDTHDALVEQLSDVKTEAAVNAAHLREEIAALNKRLEECVRQYEESIAENKRVNESVVSALNEKVKNYQVQIDDAEKMVNEMKEANQKFEENLTARDRELLSLREAFIELKSAEFKNKKKAQLKGVPLVTQRYKENEDRTSTDGWEVEDAGELDAIIEEVEGAQRTETGENDEVEVQSALNDFLEVGRLRVALEEAEKFAHAEASAREQEAKLRVELEEKVDSLKSEAAELSQKLRVVTEECESSKTKLEVLSEYFNKREAERQKDLGRKEFSQSEMSQELNILREKQRTSEVEINTLRDQLSSARRELAETERVNRRHIGELDKRLHENRLANRSLENQVKDLRAENAMLRQKMFVGDRGVLPPLLTGVPPPPPPPPPPAIALASSQHPEVRPISRQSEKSVSSRSQLPPPPPFLPFSQIPLAGPGGSQFIPPPPPGLFLSQVDANRQSPSTSDAPRSGLKVGSTSGSNRSTKPL